MGPLPFFPSPSAANLRRTPNPKPRPLDFAPPKEKASGLRGSEFPAGGNKVDPSPYPPPKGEVGERKPRGGRLAAAAAFRLLELREGGVWGWVFYGGRQLAEKASPAQRGWYDGMGQIFLREGLTGWLAYANI